MARDTVDIVFKPLFTLSEQPTWANDPNKVEAVCEYLLGTIDFPLFLLSAAEWEGPRLVAVLKKLCKIHSKYEMKNLKALLRKIHAKCQKLSSLEIEKLTA